VEEGKDEETEKKILDKRQAPEYVVIFQAKDDYLKGRIKELPEEKVVGTHWTEDGMNRRIGGYKKNNFSDNGAPVLETFFKENGIQILKLDVDALQTDDVFKSVKIFLEKQGKFENYQNFESVADVKRQQVVEDDNKKKVVEKAEGHRKLDEKEHDERKLQEEKAKLKMEAIKEEEKKLLDVRSQPLRQYLADNVVPALTEGIIQICKEKPMDPIDFLAEFLFKKSLQVKNPDPAKVDNKEI